MKIPLLVLFGTLSGALFAETPRTPRLVLSSPGRVWEDGSCAADGEPGVGARVLRWDGAASRQRIDGFGGCFNEKGWEALGLVTPTARTEVLEHLFDPTAGCGFTFGRLPVGANDYSLDWYSYDEVPEDFELRHFSIERDRKMLIPYVHAAQKLAPGLRFWASPWCPPSWMKTSGNYAGTPSSANTLRPEQAGQEMVTQFRMQAQVLDTYARYIARYVEAYRNEGIPVAAVHVQNEPNSAQSFPSCVWTPADLGEFAVRHLGPALAELKPAAELWLGTIERPQLERIKEILDLDAKTNFIKGVGFQWAGKGAIAAVHQAYPDMPLMQTESECGDGSNDWAAARHTFDLIHHYLSNGANAYLYWNMVLDETGASTWGWRQNALVTINRSTRTITYNPEYYVMRHFGAFVQPGAVRLEVADGGVQALGFLNPDGSRVLVCGNPGAEAVPVSVECAGRRWQFLLPAEGFGTLVF